MTALHRQVDVLAMAAGLLHDALDPTVLDEPTVWSLMDDLEHAEPLDVALAGAGLIVAVVRELAAVTGELSEDVLQRVALAAAAHIPTEP